MHAAGAAPHVGDPHIRLAPAALAAAMFLLAAPIAVAQSNVAREGTAYRWAHNTVDTSNANRSRASRLNDGRTDGDLRLGDPEAAAAYQAGGVLWSTVRSIGQVSFVNGSWDPTQDGAYCADLKLQYTTDGRAWRNTGWSVAPAYPYNSPTTAGATYSFTGQQPLSVRGVRISGKLRCSVQSSYWTNLRELMAYGTAPPTDTVPPTAPTGLQASVDTDRVNLIWNESTDNVGVSGYEVFRDGALLAPSALAAYADASVVAGVRYIYQVRAVDAAGNHSALSAQASIVFQPAPPSEGPIEPGTVGFLGDESTLTIIDGNGPAPAGCYWYPLESSLHCRGNVTLDRVLIRGGIDHYGDGNLTLTNSVLEGGPNFRGVWLRRGNNAQCVATIADTTLRWRTAAPVPGNNGAIVDMDGCRVNAIRNDISGWSVGFQVGTGGTIEANHIHDLYDASVDPITGEPRPCRKPDGTDYNHIDGIQFFGGSDFRVARNYIDVGWRLNPPGCQTAAIFMGNGTVDRPLFTANFLSGGGFTFRSHTANNVEVVNNIFEPLPGQYGNYLIDPGTVTRWSGNRLLDGTPLDYNP